jgi:HlyD family secretion protein
VGVTYSKGYKINADRSALVKTIAVVPGQQVKVGDVLIELTSFNLELDLDRLENRIATLQAERAEKSKLANSEIAYIKADLGIEIEKLNVAIIQTESELALNKKLSNEFSEQELNENNPLKQKIDALKLQRTRYEEAIKIKIADILQETSTEERLLDNQVRLLEQEREMHLAEKNNLRKVAIVEGVVESIFVKPGEQVDAYSELLSVNPVHPTTVVGYLVGKKNALPIGAEVVVRSYENQRLTAQGKVIGYGSVVPLPDILQKSTAVTGFGREFFVEISAQNSFANGERVLIR